LDSEKAPVGIGRQALFFVLMTNQLAILQELRKVVVEAIG